MDAIIKVKDGSSITVKNLRVIKRISTNDSSITEENNFENFVLYNSPYVFVGSDIASIDGNNIEYVFFYQD